MDPLAIRQCQFLEHLRFSSFWLDREGERERESESVFFWRESERVTRLSLQRVVFLGDNI